MWPFKRKPVQTWDELVATFDPAPCGDQYKHYYWERLEGMPCPLCKRAEDEAAKERELRRLAELTAGRVMELLKIESQGKNKP